MIVGSQDHQVSHVSPSQRFGIVDQNIIDVQRDSMILCALDTTHGKLGTGKITCMPSVT